VKELQGIVHSALLRRVDRLFKQRLDFAKTDDLHCGDGGKNVTRVEQQSEPMAALSGPMAWQLTRHTLI
jgi:hypothetical protein